MAGKEKSFEEALLELEQLVQDLEHGDVDLKEAVGKYNKGMELSQYCHQLLEQAEEVIVKMMKDNKEEDFSK